MNTKHNRHHTTQWTQSASCADTTTLVHSPINVKWALWRSVMCSVGTSTKPIPNHNISYIVWARMMPALHIPYPFPSLLSMKWTGSVSRVRVPTLSLIKYFHFQIVHFSPADGRHCVVVTAIIQTVNTNIQYKYPIQIPSQNTIQTQIPRLDSRHWNEHWEALAAWCVTEGRRNDEWPGLLIIGPETRAHDDHTTDARG